MKTLLFVLIISFAFISCKDDKDKDDSYSGGYFPLEVGNEWHYKQNWSNTDSAFYYIKVESKIEKNNKTYYVVSFDGTNLDGLPQYKNIYTNDGIYYYENIDNEDKLFLVFKDTLITENTVMGLKLNCNISDVSQTLETSAGTFSNLATISTGAVEVDGGYTEVFAKNIGMINRIWFRSSYDLIYCKVGDKEYGEK
jgi:hypothetical protein